MSSGAMVNQTVDIQLDFQVIQQIEHTPITQVNSYNSSFDNQYLIISTERGIVIVFNPQFKFKCYLNQFSPFYIETRSIEEQRKGIKISFQSKQLAVKLASLVPNRNEAALVPNFSNKHFQSTHVYIFDYQMSCILHSIDFFLQISQMQITESQLILSNKKRLIIYNYQNDGQNKNQKWYLDMYQSQKQNDKIRYFQTDCEDYQDQFTINEIIEVTSQQCMCGKFYMSSGKPYIVLFIQTISYNNQRRKKISIYNQKEDSLKQFLKENIPDQSPFQMAISGDGDFVAFTFNWGKKIKIYSLKQNCLYCILYVSSQIKQILKMQFFKARIQGKQTLCLGMIRKGKNSTATMHIFKTQKKTPTEQIKSQYRRYFPLYEQTFKDYGISSELINPGIFMENNVLYVYSLCGIAFQVIDFQRTGNRQQKVFQMCNTNHIKWNQEKDNNF